MLDLIPWEAAVAALGAVAALIWRVWDRWQIRRDTRHDVELDAWRREDDRTDAARKAMDARAGDDDDDAARRKRMRERGIGRDA
ncbi:MAG: hypothetical protein AAGC92_16420 [Pseudomonadota bacterium]